MELTTPAIAVLAVCALDLIVAGIILLQNPRSAVNISFSLFALSGVLWALGISFFLSVTDPALINFFARFLYFGGSCVTSMFLLFAVVFKRDSWPSAKVSAAIFAPVAVLFILYFFSNLLVANYLVTPAGVRGFVYGDFHYLFDVALWGNFLVALWIYGQIYRTAEKTKGNQALIIMLGTYINVSLAAATNIIGPSFFGYFAYLWVGPFAMIVWVLSVAYAVSRYQLFNIRVIAAELFVMALWLFLVVRMSLSNSILDFWINAASFLIAFVLGSLVIRSVIHEVKQREKIEKQEQALQTANAQQEGLLHFISHEIKGYLTKNEAAFAAIRAGDFGEVQPELRTMAGNALTDTRKGVNTVMDILDASNLKKGTVTYKKASFDLVNTISEIVNELAPSATEKGLKLAFKKPLESAPYVGDEDKLRRHVFRNIIDNSIKYTQHGSVEVELTHAQSGYRFVVTDTGVGITAEDMPRLFTEGGHGKDSIKINVHSTGYGLFIAKQIVDAHGGKVWAESEGAGKGSRFVVELPA